MFTRLKICIIDKTYAADVSRVGLVRAAGIELALLTERVFEAPATLLIFNRKTDLRW